MLLFKSSHENIYYFLLNKSLHSLQQHRFLRHDYIPKKELLRWRLIYSKHALVNKKIALKLSCPLSLCINKSHSLFAVAVLSFQCLYPMQQKNNHQLQQGHL